MALLTVIGRGVRVRGRIQGEGDLTIEGHVEGEISVSGALTVDPAGLVGANINARTQWWAGGFGVLDLAPLHLTEYLISRGAHIDIHAAARLGMANHEAIAAAKAGIQGLALSAAATYAPRNLRFNCVAPGLTRTPLTARITGNETVAKGSLAMHALGRFGDPADVASAIEWLLDPGQHWITGQILGVDGGLATVRGRSGG